jgi:hypothetical protein
MHSEIARNDDGQMYLVPMSVVVCVEVNCYSLGVNVHPFGWAPVGKGSVLTFLALATRNFCHNPADNLFVGMVGLSLFVGPCWILHAHIRLVSVDLQYQVDLDPGVPGQLALKHL